MDKLEYLKDLFEVFRRLNKNNLSDLEIYMLFEFAGGSRISFDNESPSMAVIMDYGNFYGIDTPFGRFKYRFAVPMKGEFNRELKETLLTLFEGEKLDDISSFNSLTCGDPEIYSIRKLPWRDKRLSKTTYVKNREGCLEKSEIEPILDVWCDYIDNFGKPVKKDNIFDILFHKKENKKKY